MNNSEYEIGLAEIQFPPNWKTFQKDEIWIEVSNLLTMKYERLSLPDGYYNTNQQLIQSLNRLLGEFGDESLKEIANFRYKARRQKTVLEILKKDCIIQLSDKLSRITGIKNNGNIFSDYHSPVLGGEIMDLTDGFTHLYIYTNIAEYRAVGHDMLPLLRILPIAEKSNGITRLVTFETVHYSPVRRQLCDTIEIDIRTDTGEPVKFERGHILITLHIRKR